MAEIINTSLFADANLVAYWRFSNGAVTTDSKASFTLTAGGTPTSVAGGKFDYGVDFGNPNATSQLYKVTASDLGINGNVAISMSIWVKMNVEPAADTTHEIIKHVSTVGADRYIRTIYKDVGGTKKLTLDCSGTLTDYTVTLGTSLWYHIVMVRDIANTKGILYLNGVPVIPNATLGTGTYGVKRLNIGGDEDGTHAGTSMIGDDCAVFNRVLTAAEVGNIYDSTYGLYLLDKTANANHLTNMNGATEVTSSLPFGQSTKAVDLELSSTQYLSAADHASLSMTGNLSIEMWVKFESLPSSGNLMAFVSKYNGTGNQKSYFFGLINDTGTLKFYAEISDDGSTADSEVVAWTPSTATWYHVAFTYTAATSKYNFYVNGSLQGTEQTGAKTSIYNGTALLQIGSSGAGSFYFDGVIDDVRIWNTVRTVTEIANNRSVELTGSESGLVAYYPLESLAVNAGGNFLMNFV